MSRRPKTVELLGPLSVAIELDPSVWATVTVLPRSMLESSLRIDLYSQEGRQLSKAAIDRWRWSLEEEMTAVGEKTLPNGYTRAGYSYECGGKMSENTHRQVADIIQADGSTWKPFSLNINAPKSKPRGSCSLPLGSQASRLRIRTPQSCVMQSMLWWKRGEQRCRHVQRCPRSRNV